jgi:hypothetical protein
MVISSYNEDLDSDDIIIGNDGSGIINYRTAGNDTIIANGGDDVITAGYGTNIIDGGSGNDTVDYSFLGLGDGDLSVNLQNNTALSDGLLHTTEDKLYNIENIIGSNGDDSITGNSSNNTFYGNDGDDTLVGNGGNDNLYGDGGKDNLSGGLGNDNLYGGSGNDILDGGSDNDTLNGGEGNDHLNGGEGDDILEGGSDFDTYVFDFNGSSGIDAIKDSDKSGQININSSILSGEASYREDLENGIHQLNGYYIWKHSGILVIAKDYNNLSDNVIFLDSYTSGDFGITLEKPEEEGPDPKGNNDEVGDKIDDILDSLNGVAGTNPVRRVDPLTLDLDGDGIELINLSNSTAFFDLDADGFKENVGWVSSDDGILVYDSNNSGSVDNINELFGDTSQLGTVELAGYDSNQDGVINNSDDIFTKLQLWQDYNQDGISQTGELKSLSEYNITSIDVNPDNLVAENLESEGNLIISSSTYQYTAQEEITTTTVDQNGNQVTTTTIEDVIKTNILSNLDLAIDQTNSVSYTYNDTDGTLIDYNLNIDALLMPQSRGYGNLAAWHIAMSKDEDLLNIMKDITSISSGSFYAASGKENIDAKVEQFLYQWAETTDVTGNRGSFSAQKLATIEAFIPDPSLAQIF